MVIKINFSCKSYHSRYNIGVYLNYIFDNIHQIVFDISSWLSLLPFSAFVCVVSFSLRVAFLALWLLQFNGPTPLACWDKIYKKLKRACGSMSDGVSAEGSQERTCKPGTDMFGFSNHKVQKLIQVWPWIFLFFFWPFSCLLKKFSRTGNFLYDYYFFFIFIFYFLSVAGLMNFYLVTVVSLTIIVCSKFLQH